MIPPFWAGALVGFFAGVAACIILVGLWDVLTERL